MFVTLTVAAIINLSSLALGLAEVFRGNSLDGLFVQMFISGFAVVNSWPIYEAIALRNDKGKMPLKTSIIATLLADIDRRNYYDKIIVLEMITTTRKYGGSFQIKESGATKASIGGGPPAHKPSPCHSPTLSLLQCGSMHRLFARVQFIGSSSLKMAGKS
ncbi:X-BOX TRANSCRIPTION FACTOR-RELATED [Salix viminalis]|uniref:X-BOX TRANSCRIPTION FACTOR-RELATED n=1 Tax=Salix viminalis TaxID=40686 RepID=A0A9Q0QC54_SALVM|nr:X-BOX TRANSCRIPTION FACTOR-RELATED [Salix viminalis]